MSEQAATPRQSPSRIAALLALLAAADFGLTHLGLLLSPGPSSFAVFWPASGLLLGALLLSPPRRWVLLLAVTALPIAAFNAAAGQPPMVVGAFALGNVLEAVVGAAVARRLCGGPPNLSRLGHLFALILAGPVLASGLGGVLGAWALGRAFGIPFAPTLVSLWRGAAIGSAAVAPLLLAWAEPPRPVRLDLRRLAEVAAVAAVFLATAWLVFGPATQQLRLPASLFLPPLLWAALRFGLRGATLSALGVTLLVLACTVWGVGRFADAGNVAAGLASAQLYAVVTLFSLLAMASVIESRRQGSEALRRSERQLRLVRFAIDSASDPLVCLDPAGAVVYANGAFCAAVRRDRDACLGSPVWSLATRVRAEWWPDHWEQVKRLGTVTVELRATDPARDPAPYEIRSSYLCFDGQEYCVSAARDLRERRQAEAAMRLASVGTLAAGMAHEINNPLAYVLGNLEWLAGEAVQARERRGQPGAPTAEAVLAALEPALAETLEGATRIRDVVRDVKLFSRSGEGEAGRPALADVGRALRAAATMAKHEVRSRARLVIEVEGDLLAAANEQRLGQVFLNLVLNAAQAIPEGQVANHAVRLEARRAGDEVVVEVQDTGLGMSPAVLARIFEPFFTTKPVGVGTGLGLSICHGIVAEVGGRIEVSSRPGAGSLFRVRLPAVERSPTRAEAPPAPAPEIAARRGRILVVDDDPGVGQLVARVLAEHEVQACTSAAAALVRLGAEPFDVVLCDVTMPEMTAVEFLQRLQRLSREKAALAARTIFLTGGAFAPASSAFLDEISGGHLEKPFDSARLRGAVARALALPEA